MRLLDWILGNVANWQTRFFAEIILVSNTNGQSGGLQTLLFDVKNDVQETKNLANEHPHIVADLLKDLEKYKQNLPETPPYWMVTANWSSTFVAGIKIGHLIY